jgi:hypothetical protein
MKVIVYQGDECVSVVVPVDGVDIDLVISKDIPSGANYIVLDSSKIPSDRSFRGAWDLVGGAININLNKAKELTKERLRIERVPLLLEQDIAFQITLEDGTDTSAIVAEKKRLRDITSLVDAATTLDQLKAIKA